MGGNLVENVAKPSNSRKFAKSFVHFQECVAQWTPDEGENVLQIIAEFAENEIDGGWIAWGCDILYSVKLMQYIRIASNRNLLSAVYSMKCIHLTTL